jgi:2-polyprenyl-3-methyl-5-hydroxy-6-metoxy-1,4-benzoquinol methylase
MSNVLYYSSEQRERIRKAEQACNTAYANSIDFLARSALLSPIMEILRCKNILDIGCGKEGGLAFLAERTKAASYTGIDIDNLSVEQAKSKYPQHTFIWDDPIFFIEKADREYTIVSTGLWDLIRDETYRNALIDKIAQHTKKGEFTIHSSLNFTGKYLGLFLQRGFAEVMGDRFRGRTSIMQKIA